MASDMSHIEFPKIPSKPVMMLNGWQATGSDPKEVAKLLLGNPAREEAKTDEGSVESNEPVSGTDGGGV